MGKYLFQNGSVYFDALGKVGVVSREEFSKESFLKDKNAQVLVNDIEFKSITLTDVNLHLVEDLVAAEFSLEQIVQYEKIDTHLYQGMAATNKEVAFIHNLFNKDAIKVFIPYPLALRAFLNYKKIFDDKKVSIVIDDLQDRYVLTIFWGLKVVETREIQLKSIEKIAEEVIRSKKSFTTTYIKESSNPSFLFISNNKQLCDALLNIEEHTAENIANFDEIYPAFIALDHAKFTCHFNLPEQVLKLRHLKEFKRNLVGYIFSGVLAITSLVYFLVIEYQEHSAMDRNIELSSRKADLIEEIKLRNALVYKEILNKRAKMNLFSLYGNFIQNVPPGYLIENFSLNLLNSNDDASQWTFTAVVSSNKGLVSDFGQQGMFQDRLIENIFIKDSPAQRVVLNVTKLKGE